MAEVLSQEVVAALRTATGAKAFVGESEQQHRNDFRLAQYLLRRSIPLADVAAALRSRPDGYALSQGAEYVDRTVAAAALTVKECGTSGSDDAWTKPPADVVVLSRIVIYRSDPPRVEVTVGGVTVVTDMATLASRPRFATRLAEAMAMLPLLPSAKQYTAWMNGYLRDAVHRDVPPEASEGGHDAALASRSLANLSCGESLTDLYSGRWIENGERKTIHAPSVLARVVRLVAAKLTAPDFAAVLRDNGWSAATVRIAGEQVRVWQHKDPVELAESPSKNLADLAKKRAEKQRKLIDDQEAAAPQHPHFADSDRPFHEEA